jgi:hypothetical protein
MLDLLESGSGLYSLRRFQIKDVETSDIATMIFLVCANHSVLDIGRCNYERWIES